MLLIPFLSVAATAAVSDSDRSSAAAHSMICASPGGQFHTESLAPSAGNVLRARIRVVKTSPSENWEPIAGLLFVLPGEAGRYTGVQAYVGPADPTRLIVVLKRPHDPHLTPVAHITIKEPIDVVTQFNAGTVTVWAGGKSKSVHLPDRTSAGAIFMCSSGQFEFEF